MKPKKVNELKEKNFSQAAWQQRKHSGQHYKQALIECSMLVIEAARSDNCSFKETSTNQSVCRFNSSGT